jgi:hypothetical protein
MECQHTTSNKTRQGKKHDQTVFSRLALSPKVSSLVKNLSDNLICACAADLSFFLRILLGSFLEFHTISSQKLTLSYDNSYKTLQDLTSVQQ